MKTLKILLALILSFQQVIDFGYALPVESETDRVMSVGNQTQQEGLVAYLQQREDLASNNQVEQAASNINIPGSGYDSPAAIAIAPEGATANVTSTSRGLSLGYNTGSAGWAGAGFLYYDSALKTGTPADFSGMTELVVGLKGTPGMVKLEVKDKDGKTAAVYLTGIKSDVEQRWIIPLSYLTAQGVDLANIAMINCIVEGTDKTGTLEFNRSDTSMWVEPSAALTIQDINLPSTGLNYPSQTAIAPNDAQITNLAISERGITFNYNTEAPAGSPEANIDGWAGAGFTYDNLNTADVIESFNLKGALGNSPLVIGIKGDSGSIRLEIVDKNGQKDAVLLNNVSASQENIWSVSLAKFQGVDLNNVSYIYFVVEGANKTGHMEINRFANSVFIPADPAMTSANVNLPAAGLTEPMPMMMNPSSATGTAGISTHGIVIK
ncbi:MAG: hypothetical protein V1682_06015, partial [Candidatus Omnitrophota bacterium]